MGDLFQTVIIKLCLWVILAGFICAVAKGLSLFGAFSTIEILVGLGLALFLVIEK